ncbi:MAG: DUF2341 domain-containing protein, partial [Nanobdellota archaeon]
MIISKRAFIVIIALFILLSTFALVFASSNDSFNLTSSSLTNESIILESSNSFSSTPVRHPIAFGEPLHWTLFVNNSGESGRIEYNTPQINVDKDLAFDNDSWIASLDFETSAKDSYVDVPFSFVPPSEDKVHTSSFLKNLVVEPEAISFIIPELEGSATVRFNGSLDSSSDMALFDGFNGTYVIKSSRGVVNNFSVVNDSLFATVASNSTNNSLHIFFKSPSSLSDTVEFFFSDNKSNAAHPLSFSSYQNNTLFDIVVPVPVLQNISEDKFQSELKGNFKKNVATSFNESFFSFSVSESEVDVNDTVDFMFTPPNASSFIYVMTPFGDPHLLDGSSYSPLFPGHYTVDASLYYKNLSDSFSLSFNVRDSESILENNSTTNNNFYLDIENIYPGQSGMFKAKLQVPRSAQNITRDITLLKNEIQTLRQQETSASIDVDSDSLTTRTVSSRSNTSSSDTISSSDDKLSSDNIIAQKELLLDQKQQELTSQLPSHVNLTLNFNHSSSKVKKISFSNINIDNNELPLGFDDSISVDRAVSSFAVDPEQVDFTNATITVNATGTELYKCKDWNFTTQTCPEPLTTCTGIKGINRTCETYGGWQKLMDVVPGQLYEIPLTPKDPGFAEYDPTYTVPYCNTSESPCIANSSVLMSSGTYGGTSEPNQPNTVDGCTDGGSGSYETDEYVQNITIESLNHTTFVAGDTVRVNATVYIWGAANDVVNIIYGDDPSSPSWVVEAGDISLPGDGYREVSTTFTLSDRVGDHVVRVLNEYNGAATTTCASNGYHDNDDVTFQVDEEPNRALYDSNYGAPYCAYNASSCIAYSQSLLSGGTFSGTPEPNQPNTIDSCTDGPSGTYETDEYVQNITITTVDTDYFQANTLINVTAWVYVKDTALDTVNIMYTSNVNSPSWTVKSSQKGGFASTGYQKVSTQFAVDDIVGDHAIRVLNEYDSASTTTCATDAYSDNDDVVFNVFAQKENIVWFNESWQHRTLFNITNVVDQNVTDYSYKLTLNSTNLPSNFNWSTDEDSLRFFQYNYSDDSLINTSYWVENWSVSNEQANVWIEIPYLPASTNDIGSGSGVADFHLYYSNPTAMSESNAIDTFQFFANFSDYTIQASNTQDGADGQPTNFDVVDDYTLRIWGNPWKSIAAGVTIAGDGSQLMEFDMKANASDGEIYGVSYQSIDSSSNAGITYKFAGTQAWGDLTPETTYSEDGNWQLVDAILNDYAVTNEDISFIADDDADGNA